MTKTRNELKNIFVAGAYPDQQDYHDALDSYVHKDDLLSADQIDASLKVYQLWFAASQFAAADLTPTGILELLEQAAQQLPGQESQSEGDEQNAAEQNAAEQGTAPIQTTFRHHLADLKQRIIYLSADGKLLPPHDLPQAVPSFEGQTIAGYALTHETTPDDEGLYTYTLTLYEPDKPADTLLVCLAYLAPPKNNFIETL